MLAVVAQSGHNAPMKSPRRFRLLYLIWAPLAVAACGTELSSRIDPALPSPASVALARALVGDYSNAAQAKANPAVVELVLHVRPIWADRIDGLWLYVESALASTPDNPYRQRVYQVVDGNEALSVDSRIYDFPENPSRYAGAWKAARPLDALSPDLLVPRAGCTTTFQRAADGSWQGAMRAGECATNHNGAAYTRSEVTLTRDALSVMDRAYDTAGNVVWEASPEPLRFEKQKSTR